MPRLRVLVAILFMTGCSRPAPVPPAPQIELWNTGIAETAQLSPEKVIQNYGSHVLLVKEGSVKLRMYRIKGGSREQVASQVIDSTVHPMAAITPALRSKEAAVEISAPRVVRSPGSYSPSEEFKEVTFPIPRRFGCNLRGRTSQPAEEEELLTYWIMETDGADIGMTDMESEGAMLKRSEKKDVSFVRITVSP